jgi:UDP-glucose 4-epimerase
MDVSHTNGEIYNVGSTERIAIRELADRVREAADSASEIEFVPYEEVFPHGSMEEMFHRVPSIDKIMGAIGWRPERSLEDILDDVISFERKQLSRVEVPG